VTALQISAALMAFIAIGFGAPAPFIAAHLLRERTLPIFMNTFPAYGGPLSERLSPEVFAILLGLFTALSALELFAAVLLWQGHQLGGLLTIALLPFEIAFWAGFALPIPPMVAIARLALLWSGWSGLR
jgi:hypothetical protein